MFATAVRAKMRGVIVDDLNVRQQSSARIRTLDQVVAQDGVRRKAMAEYFAEDVHIVNAFSSENAFSKQFLVNIRNRASVDIQAGLAGVDIRQSRAIRGMDADAHARLEHAVALLYGIGCRINFRAIQRVSGGADQSMSAVTWQLGVRVEG